MDLQTILIAFVQGKCQDFIVRISKKDLEKLLKDIQKQTDMYERVTDSGMIDIKSIPYANRYSTIAKMIESELTRRKGLLNVKD
jgi:hypothetical protein